MYEQKSETAICSYGLFGSLCNSFGSIWAVSVQSLEHGESFLLTFGCPGFPLAFQLAAFCSFPGIRFTVVTQWDVEMHMNYGCQMLRCDREAKGSDGEFILK